jgi:dihydrofolate synthase / folylpolyglutamate synthase
MLASVLQAAGYTVGATISPHLMHPAERVQLNNQPASLALLDDLSTQLAQACRLTGVTLTYFEAMIALAFLAFAQHPVDIGLIEVGLGGRLDATNVLAKPVLTVLTGVDYDHTEWLGDTLAKIATEKVGIFKPNVPVVLGPSLAPEVSAVALAKATQLNCPVAVADSTTWVCERVDLATGVQWLRHTNTPEPLALGLLGPYQVQNVATVLAVVDQLIQQGWTIPQSAIQQGLATARWPARLQWLADQRLLVDGSHNPQGFTALTQALPTLFNPSGVADPPPLHWLLSLRANRNPADLLAVVRSWPQTASITFTTAGPGHATGVYHPPDTLQSHWLAVANSQTLGDIALYTQPCPTKALAHVQGLLAQAPLGHVGVVTGSLYTAGGVLQALQGADKG